MTCIVGVEHEGSVWLGGDSIAIEDGANFSLSLADPKVFINNGIGFGFCGSLRAGQLLKYALHVPPQPTERDDMGYLVIDVIDAIREIWTSKGTQKNENSVEETAANALIAYNGKLYYFDEDMQIGRTPAGFLAIGCGAAYAVGALEVLKDADMHPEAKLRAALAAADRWCPGVQGPYTVICVPEANFEKKNTNSRKRSKI